MSALDVISTAICLAAVLLFAAFVVGRAIGRDRARWSAVYLELGELRQAIDEEMTRACVAEMYLADAIRNADPQPLEPSDDRR